MRRNIFTFKKTIIFALLFFGFIFNHSDNVFAVWNIVEGEGADTNMSSANCGNYLHGHVGLCGSPLGSNGGGASWHIYNTSSSPYSVLGYHPNIMYSDKRGSIASSCPSSTYKWYVVYGWDGRFNNDIVSLGYNGNTSGYLQYGPITYDSNLPYNTYNEVKNLSGSSSLQELYAAASGIQNGTKISNSVAADLYNKFTKAATGTAK